MSTDFDSPWKEALDLYFEQFLALLFPEVQRQIDWSHPAKDRDIVLAHRKTQDTRKSPEDRYAWKVRLVRGLYE